MKEGGEGGGGEEVEVDGRSGLGAGGLVSQRDGRGVWRVETMALIPIVRPRGGESERERERDDLKGDSYYVLCKTRVGPFIRTEGRWR